MPPTVRLAVFVGLACLALAIRLPQLGERPMHTDEAVNGYLTGQLLAGESYQYDPRDRHGPALYAVALPIARVAGEKNLAELTESALRLGPVLVGAAMILLFAAAANQIGFLPAVIAALLFALGPLPVYYSRDFIHETLFVAVTLGLLLACGRALANRSALLGVGAGVCAGLMLACKETAPLHFAVVVGAAAWWFFAARRGAHSPPRRSTTLRFFVAALAAFLIVVLAMFTWGGRHWQGLFDLVRAVPRFAARAAGEGHEKPFGYYFALLGGGGSGAIVLALALVGGVAVLLKRPKPSATPAAAGLISSGEAPDGPLQLLLIYAVGICAVYSFIPYKTPWLALNLWLPLALLAGCGGAAIWRAAGSGAIRGLVLTAAVTLLVLLGRDTLQRVFRQPADERNPYAYAQTLEDLLRLPERVSQLARQGSSGNIPRIAVIAADPWPLPWCLRHFPQVGFWQPDQEPGRADFYITSAEAAERPGAPWAKWRPEFFGLRPEKLVILWSPPESEVRHD